MRTSTLTYETHFDAGHIVSWHGKCGRVHGHTYKVIVTLGGEVAEDRGIVLDFGALKELAEKIVSEYDHKFIVSNQLVTKADKHLRDDPDRFVFIKWEISGGINRVCLLPVEDVVQMEGEATAENIAYDIQHRLAELSMLKFHVQVFEGLHKSASAQ